MPRGKHGNHARGSNQGRWNNGRIIASNGYVKVRVGLGHPLADPNGYAYEHLVVWISAGNQRPKSNELIHHLNEDKTDNRLQNLSLVGRSEHARLHNLTRPRCPLTGRFAPTHTEVQS